MTALEGIRRFVSGRRDEDEQPDFGRLPGSRVGRTVGSGDSVALVSSGALAQQLDLSDGEIAALGFCVEHMADRMPDDYGPVHFQPMARTFIAELRERAPHEENGHPPLWTEKEDVIFVKLEAFARARLREQLLLFVDALDDGRHAFPHECDETMRLALVHGALCVRNQRASVGEASVA